LISSVYVVTPKNELPVPIAIGLVFGDLNITVPVLRIDLDHIEPTGGLGSKVELIPLS
jgi:hypothetical protein